ncbi:MULTISPECIES: hypothetical protein [unclassified Enterococcus]|uniref:hypothetical protein n=1 Tax=unclassified Enterococcus TaxID=2608891 RepID=UPI001CE07F15|nr:MULTISPECIES: hypothetical protein [unclassified Enterococcus]MCA5014514.1 hypothetical protein [Enterococcus sp. S23]MCA5017767.1 hypothetical protein [Enterococcus sp. S22(2020)]
MYVIQMTDEFGITSIFSSTYRWGGEVKALIAIEGVNKPKIYSSEKRAKQGLKSLELRLAAADKMEIIPYGGSIKKNQQLKE